MHKKFAAVAALSALGCTAEMEDTEAAGEAAQVHPWPRG
jgi:hypothetical protein